MADFVILPTLMLPLSITFRKNPHFVKSALARFTQWDFIALITDYGISYYEKESGQLFCHNSAEDIVNMLRGSRMQ